MCSILRGRVPGLREVFSRWLRRPQLLETVRVKAAWIAGLRGEIGEVPRLCRVASPGWPAAIARVPLETDGFGLQRSVLARCPCTLRSRIPMSRPSATFATLSDDQRRLLESLASHAAHFVVIGGYAVRHYVRKRVTRDLDIWLQRSEQNADRICAALERLGPTEDRTVIRAAILAVEKRLEWKNGPDGPEAELFTSMRGVDLDWREVAEAAVGVVVADTVVPVVSQDHLIVLKVACLADPLRTDESKRRTDANDLHALGVETVS